MVRYVLLAAALALASGPAARAEDKESRERKVRVALALADAKPETKAAAPTVAVKAPVVALDWFGDGPAKVAHATPCICGDSCKCAAGTCPGACPVGAKAAATVPTYVRECFVDQWGRTSCHWVLMSLPAAPATGK